MMVRILSAAAVAALVTWGLLGLMQILIVTGHSAFSESTFRQMVDFVRIPRAEQIQRRDRKPKKPTSPEAPPPDVPPPAQDPMNAGADALAVMAAVPTTAPSTDANVNISTGFGFAASDGEFLPLVKVAPMYPRRAAALGLEGWVMLSFTVTRIGTVKDVIVLESSHSMFERAAVSAALKFKYKPRIIDGVAVDVIGVKNKITFILEDA